MRFLALAALLVLASPLAAQQATLQADLRAQLVKQLDGVAGALKGVIGYRIVDLTSGEQVAARLDKEPFPTASTIKLSVLYEMFKQAEAGRSRSTRRRRSTARRWSAAAAFCNFSTPRCSPYGIRRR